jgi:imidazolonepropionase-like amidohydrolase
MKPWIAVLMTSILSGAYGALADTVVVTADRMVDVLDGRITEVSGQGVPVAPGARRIELPGMTLLPGLIDMHEDRYRGCAAI